MSEKIVKPIIKEIVVVEGKSDSQKLKSLYEVDTIETNGSELENKTINLIAECSKSKEIIIFTDNDYTGENIRKKIQNILPKSKHAFMPSEKGRNCVGEGQKVDIEDALKNFVSYNSKNKSFLWNDYLSLNINTKNKRAALCKFLKISFCNNKQLYLRINYMGRTLEEIKSFLEKNNDL